MSCPEDCYYRGRRRIDDPCCDCSRLDGREDCFKDWKSCKEIPREIKAATDGHPYTINSLIRLVGELIGDQARMRGDLVRLRKEIQND